MIYEIKRHEGAQMVTVQFADHAPVEVRNELIAHGFSWDEWRKAWVALDRMSDSEIRAMIDSVVVHERPVMSKAEEKALHDEYMARVMAGEDERWRKYYEDYIGGLVKLEDGRIVCIRKPRIETNFCFGESGYDSEEANNSVTKALSSEDYFRAENLKALDAVIAFLSRDRNGEIAYNSFAAVENEEPGVAHYVTYHRSVYSAGKEPAEVSEEDRERILEGYQRVRAAFEKRLNAYLKRYGLSKVRSWTYWRDA